MATSSADFNAQIIEEFHANQGRVGGIFEGAPLLLLHHTGAKSDKNRINPLGYHSDGERYVVCASNGGAPRNPDWYYNLKAHPNVTIEVGTAVCAETAYCTELGAGRAEPELVGRVPGE